MNEETSSLPSQEYEVSDSGSELASYVIRITPCEKFSFQQVVEFIKSEPQIFTYVVGRETVPREHFHLVVQTDEAITLEDVRGIVRAFLYPFWQSEDFKLPRGFGNKQYNLQIATELDRAVSYAVKLGEYVFEGFSEEYINERRAESFEKKKPCNFKAEYQELSQKFQESDMDVREFMIGFCNLKARYDQQINMSHAYGYALSNQIRRDGNAEEVVENYLYNK